jgi:hypothetical protein
MDAEHRRREAIARLARADLAMYAGKPTRAVA